MFLEIGCRDDIRFFFLPVSVILTCFRVELLRFVRYISEMITENHFEKIAIELRPMLLDLGYRFFADKSKAEDVVQEVLMRLWVMRNRLGPDDNIKALSVRMAKNVCVSQWRHERQVKEFERVEMLLAVEKQQSKGDVSEWLEEKENDIMLADAKARLTDSEKKLIAMSNDEGLKAAQIAEITGMTAHSVSTILGRARHKLIEMIKKGGKR